MGLNLQPTPGAAADSPEQSCASAPQFHAFDFWLGNWEVFDRASGKLAGHNTISVIEHGCALLESWRGSRGSTGTSLNYYNPLSGQWRQLWVANGYSIDIAGGLNAAGAMVLEGEIFDYKSRERAPFRGTWTPMPEGWVRQHFEQFDAAKSAWVNWFDGKYVKADGAKQSPP